MKKEYSRVKDALEEVEATGYGIIMPDTDELKLEDAFKFLANNKNLKANVDMKSTANMEAVQKLADKYKVTKQIFFNSFKPTS